MTSAVDDRHHLAPSRLGRLARGVWRVADPKITLASVAGMFLGACGALAAGELSLSWLALTVLGIFFLEAAKNTSGEIFDFDSGTDQAIREEERSPFSGGKRLLVDGLMTRREAAVTAAVFYLLGSAAGLAIVLAREPAVLLVGVAGVALAYFYHAPPLQLSYRGLGELAVGLTYGPLITAGTFLVQRHTLSGQVLYLSVPLGMLIAAFLWVNELPDLRADAEAGKRTLVVRLGRERAARLIAYFFGGAYALLALAPLFGLPFTVYLGLASVPLGVRAARRIRTAGEDIQALVPAQAWTLLSFLLLAGGTGLGWALAPLLP